MVIITIIGIIIIGNYYSDINIKKGGKECFTTLKLEHTSRICHKPSIEIRFSCFLIGANGPEQWFENHVVPRITLYDSSLVLLLY